MLIWITFMIFIGFCSSTNSLFIVLKILVRTFFKNSLFTFHQRKKVINVQNVMRVSKQFFEGRQLHWLLLKATEFTSCWVIKPEQPLTLTNVLQILLQTLPGSFANLNSIHSVWALVLSESKEETSSQDATLSTDPMAYPLWHL